MQKVCAKEPFPDILSNTEQIGLKPAKQQTNPAHCGTGTRYVRMNGATPPPSGSFRIFNCPAARPLHAITLARIVHKSRNNKLELTIQPSVVTVQYDPPPASTQLRQQNKNTQHTFFFPPLDPQCISFYLPLES